MSETDNRTRGQVFYDTVDGSFDLDHSERELLTEAKRLLDRADDIHAEIDRQGMTTLGSQGQIRHNPLLAEERSTQQTLVKVLSQLKVDDSNDNGAKISELASHAARARWHKN